MAGTNIETSFSAAIKAGKINGAIICATDAQGHFTYNKTIGERTLLSGEKKPHQLDDVLCLASATKLMATIAALTCVQDGLLSLTGDLSQVAPELTSKQVLTGFSDQDEPILEPVTQPITLEMLLTHTAGLVYYFLDPQIARWRSKYGPQAQEGHVPAKLSVEDLYTYPLSSQPGTGWMYGPNLDWAGRIVERATSTTLLSHLQTRVFTPLGLSPDQQFQPVTREDLRSRMVDLNPLDPEGLGAAVMGGSAFVQSVPKGAFGGHGLFMTAPDYLKVLQSLLVNDGRILDPKLVDSMFENHLNTPDAIEGHARACAGPMGAFFRCGIDTGTAKGHGLGGILTLEGVEGWYGTNTLTWGGGQTLAWFIDRTNDLCGICAIQATLPTVDGLAIAELKQIFRHDIYRKRREWLAEKGH